MHPKSIPKPPGHVPNMSHLLSINKDSGWVVENDRMPFISSAKYDPGRFTKLQEAGRTKYVLISSKTDFTVASHDEI